MARFATTTEESLHEISMAPIRGMARAALKESFVICPADIGKAFTFTLVTGGEITGELVYLDREIANIQGTRGTYTVRVSAVIAKLAQEEQS